MNSEMLNSMRDAFGLPFYPVVFQLLMVLSFTIHILFVNLTLGSSLLTAYGYLKGGNFWGIFRKTLPKVTTVSISMTILFGVAPLLFVQTLYDPFWYTSNNLSQWWVIGFIFILMSAYGLTYVVYMREKSSILIAILVFILFLTAGVIMHGLNYQMLLPDRWYEWYTEGGKINPYGTSLHGISIPRLLHFLIPAIPVMGIFMMLYAWYFKDRDDIDGRFLETLAGKGASLAFYGTLIQFLAGIWWLLSLSSNFKFYLEPIFVISVVSAMFLLHTLYFAKKQPMRFAISSGVLLVLTLIFMSVSRERLRMKYAGLFNYSIYDYPLKVDLLSTLFFVLTFGLCISVIIYLIYVAYKAGKSAKFESTPAIDKWGSINIILLVLWIFSVILLGFSRS